MIDYYKNFYQKISFVEKCFFTLICFLPISMIIGNLLINLTFFLILILFIIDFVLNKKRKFLRENYFWLLIFFFFTLLINLYFSLEPTTTLPRVLKVLMIIPFVIFMRESITKYQSEFENIIYGFWSIIFSVLVVDIVFEMIFGFNTIGLKSYMPGRIASFFGDELVAGSFFLAFSFIVIVRLSSFFRKYKNIKLAILIISLFIISFLIGERSNFIKFFIISFFLFFFIIKLDFKHKTYGILLLIATLFLFFNFNENIKYRYYSQNIKNFNAETKNLEKIDSKNSIIYAVNQIDRFIKNSTYGAHYNAAYKIFLAHPYFGIGIKNYRNESPKEKYKNEEYTWTDKRNTTHPHQIHFEVLSETGLFGYMTFFIFILTSLFLSIRNYFIYKNFYQLVALLYVTTALIPYLPSGSFFSTYASSLFWINYAIMISYNKKTKS